MCLCVEAWGSEPLRPLKFCLQFFPVIIGEGCDFENKHIKIFFGLMQESLFLKVPVNAGKFLAVRAKYDHLFIYALLNEYILHTHPIKGEFWVNKRIIFLNDARILFRVTPAAANRKAAAQRLEMRSQNFPRRLFTFNLADR